MPPQDTNSVDEHGLDEDEPTSISEGKNAYSPRQVQVEDTDILEYYNDIFQIREEESRSPDEPLALKLLKEDMQVARQSVGRGERSKAGKEYSRAIQNYLTDMMWDLTYGIWKDRPFVQLSVTELGECFAHCAANEIPASACICLEILEKLNPIFSPISKTRAMVLQALESILKRYFRGQFNLQHVIAALNDGPVHVPLLSALRSFFERRPHEFDENCKKDQ